MTADLEAAWHRIRDRKSTLKDEAQLRGLPPKAFRKILRQAGLWPDGWYLQRGTVEGATATKKEPGMPFIPWPDTDYRRKELLWDQPIRPGQFGR